MNRAQQLIADRSFGERQQQRFVHGIGRALRCRIEVADGFDFVAEKFDADRALGFGRIDIEDAAAQSVLSGHFDHVGGGVADSVQVGEKVVDIERLAAAQDAGQVGVVFGRAQPDRRRGHRSDHDRGCAGGDLPQRGGALFLKFRMRRKILKRQHVASRQGDDRFGIAGARQFAEALQHGDEILDGAVVIDDNDERTVGISPQKYQQQSFCRWGESGDTNAPRALPQMGGNTREGGKLFYVREEFADEGKKHANSILTGTSVRRF